MRRGLFPGLALSFVVLGLTACASRGSTPAASDPPPGTTRYIVGGDSRDDKSHVVKWAFAEAKARGASAFFFLGDMELTPQWDSKFQKELEDLKPMPFYPAIGNHEVVLFGTQLGIITRLEGFLDPDQVQENINKFTKKFLNTAQTPVTLAPLKGKVAFSTNVKTIHWISLDNVSQPGFGQDQLAWLETDLKAANADPAKPWIFVGMHKALYNNGTTTHAMGGPAREELRQRPKGRDRGVEQGAAALPGAPRRAHHREPRAPLRAARSGQDEVGNSELHHGRHGSSSEGPRSPEHDREAPYPAA